MVSYSKNLQSLDSYLRNLFESKNPIGFPFDGWVKILSNLYIFENNYPKSSTYPNGGKKIRAIFSEMEEFNKEYKFVPKEIPVEYPFDNQLLENILSINGLDIGNPELGEIIRINHLEPLRYLYNLEELSICNNTVTTLSPIWYHPSLKRVWIENTLIPIEERNRFRSDHPSCKLLDQVYL